MLNEPVSLLFVVETIGVIVGVIGLGILMVRNAKKRKNTTVKGCE